MRRAIAADWGAIIALHGRASAYEREQAGIAFQTSIADAQHHFRGELHVAYSGGRLVGFVAWMRNEIAWLYVEPALFRRGIGTVLLRYAAECCGFIAHVRVLAGNRPMLSLCGALGFIEVEEETRAGPSSVLLRRVGGTEPGRPQPMICRAGS